MSVKQILKSALAVVVDVVTVFLIIAFGIWQINTVNKRVSESAEKIYTDIVAQSVKYIQKEMNSYIKLAEVYAAELSDYENMSEEDIRQTLNKFLENGGFFDLILIDRDGKPYSHLYENTVLSSRDYFKTAIKGIPNVSQTIAGYDGKPDWNAFAVPVLTNGEINGVLAGAVSAPQLLDALELNLFDENSCSYIVNKEGVVIISPKNDAYGFDGGVNILEELDLGDESYYTLKSDFSIIGASGIISAGGYVVAYNSVDINDFILITIIPNSVIYAHVNNLSQTETVFVIVHVTIICLLIVVLTIMFILNRKKLSFLKSENVRLSTTDPLTNCDTFDNFSKKVSAVLKMDDYYVKQYALAVDINKFRAVNDILGYEKGNFILKKMAEIIKRNLEKEDAVTRINDVFYCVLSREDEKAVTETIKLIVNDINYQITDINIILSFGIYYIDDRKVKIRTALDRADMARHTVKDINESSYAFFDVNILINAREEKEIEDMMEEALEKGEFIPFLQPKYSLQMQEDTFLNYDGGLSVQNEAQLISLNNGVVISTSVVGAEALVRWKKDNKLIAPFKFIPLFEKNGFISRLDKYIFEEVCKKTKQWINKNLPVKIISVNVSRVNLKEPYFMQELSDICQKYSVPTRYFEIEITESAVFENFNELKKIFYEIKKLGFHTSMDDFGTGYSSLNMLKDFPIDVLKIDRAFLSENEHIKNRAYMIIEHIISLARELGVKTICEGVETEEQVERLRDIGCDDAQGFFFAKPMPIDEYENLVYGKYYY